MSHHLNAMGSLSLVKRNSSLCCQFNGASRHNKRTERARIAQKKLKLDLDTVVLHTTDASRRYIYIQIELRTCTYVAVCECARACSLYSFKIEGMMSWSVSTRFDYHQCHRFRSEHLRAASSQVSGRFKTRFFVKGLG